MKTYRFLAALLLSVFLTVNYTVAQNEIERYKQPELIEGITFTLTAAPSYSNKNVNDTTKYSTLILNLGAEFNEWKFSPNVNHALYFKMDFNFQRNEYKEYSFDTVYNISRGNMNFNGGVSYYPFKNPVYGGFYFNSRSEFIKSNKPSSNNNLYAFAGYGKFDNAGQVSVTENLEKIFLEEKVIKTGLSRSALRKLTELLDRRFNREFSARYKDDADIEFFAQIENLLLDEKL